MARRRDVRQHRARTGRVFVRNNPTIAAVFPEVHIFETHDDLSSFIIAAITPRKLSRDDLLARGKAAVERGTVPHLLERHSDPAASQGTATKLVSTAHYRNWT